MGDRLWTGKPPRRRTRRPGLLSVSHPFVGKRSQYLAKAGIVNICTSPDKLARIRGLAVFSWWLAVD